MKRPATSVEPFVPRVVLYTTEWCGFCIRAKMLLEQRGITFREVSLADDPSFRETIYELGKQWTVPCNFDEDYS